MTELAVPLPKISVIIPLYNKAPYIKRALDSVLAQTVQNFEIVVVGGHSSDGGEDIVKGYADPRIHFIQEPGRGVSVARNYGVSVANAELIAFLDADDVWLPQFLETILRLREKYPNAGMYATGHIDSKNITVSKDNTEILPPIATNKIDNDLLITNLFQYFNHHPDAIHQSAVCVPKVVFLHVGGYRTDCQRGEDSDFFGKIGLYGYSVGYCTDKLSIYYSETPNSLTSQHHLAQLDEHPFQNTVRRLKSLPEHNSELISLQDYDLMLYLDILNFITAGNNLNAGCPRGARKCLSRIYHKELRKAKYLKYLLTYVPRRIITIIKYFVPLKIKIV